MNIFLKNEAWHLCTSVLKIHTRNTHTLEGRAVLDGYMQAPHVEHPEEQKQSLAAVVRKQRYWNWIPCESFYFANLSWCRISPNPTPSIPARPQLLKPVTPFLLFQVVGNNKVVRSMRKCCNHAATWQERSGNDFIARELYFLVHVWIWQKNQSPHSVAPQLRPGIGQYYCTEVTVHLILLPLPVPTKPSNCSRKKLLFFHANSSEVLSSTWSMHRSMLVWFSKCTPFLDYGFGRMFVRFSKCTPFLDYCFGRIWKWPMRSRIVLPL